MIDKEYLHFNNDIAFKIITLGSKAARTRPAGDPPQNRGETHPGQLRVPPGLCVCFLCVCVCVLCVMCDMCVLCVMCVMRVCYV